MNRADLYLKQIHAMQAWLAAQGDDEGAALADELAERLNRDHEAVDDRSTPDWEKGDDVEADAEPDIRCTPGVGIVFDNREGEPILTIDMLDGGDVAVVHMLDVVRWVERRGAPAVDRPTAISGEIHDARANRIPETPEEARERAAYEATVGNLPEGEVVDAEFEVVDAEFEDDAEANRDEETAAAFRELFNATRAKRSASIPDEMALLDTDDDGEEGPDDIDLTGDANDGSEDDEP